MATVRKQTFTRPIPTDAVATTLKVRKRGKDATVAAVWFKGDDGRQRTRPVV